MEYKDFGVMLCSASNGIMRVEKLKEFIDKISLFGYNLLELCIDDMLEVENEPFYGYLRGRYTKKEIQEIEEYAQKKGVEIVPCIQVLAHMEHILKHPCYGEIADTGSILLVDEPKTYEFLNNVLKSVSETFSSRKINIGYDEAHSVGLGAYLSKNGYTDRYELLMRHLDKVVGIADKYGLKVHMWGDMFLRLASKKFDQDIYAEKGLVVPKEVRERVPQGVGLCYWDYGSVEEDIYDDIFRVYEGFNRDFWFAGTSWTCRGFAPMNTFSTEPLMPAMKQVIKHNVEHVLITLWGDSGNPCSYFVSLPILYAVRQFANGNFDMDSIKKGFEDIMGERYDDYLALDLPNKNKHNYDLKRVDRTSESFLYNDVFLGLMDPVIKEIAPIPFKEYKEQLIETKKRMKQYAYLFDKLIELCNVLELKAELGVRTRDAYRAQNKELLKVIVLDYYETIERIKQFKETFRKEWMLENKVWNWNVHEMRLSGLMARIGDCARRLDEFIKGDVDSIPELEEELLSYAPYAWYPHMDYNRLAYPGSHR